MPGFLRKAAGSAAVAGAVTAVGRRMQRRQAEQAAGGAAPVEPVQQAPQPVPAQRTAPSTTDVVDQLRALGQLRTDGLLTDEEFAAQKAKILAG